MTADANKLGFLDTLKADMYMMEMRRKGILYAIYCFFMRADFLAVFLFRLSSACVDKGIWGKAASIFFWRLNILLNSCEIHPEAKIGAGFSLAHPVGVVIGPVNMGRNVEIFQNVSLGRRDRDDAFSGPGSRALVGDNVIIYSGAVVVGGVRIGSGASIGANAVVLCDVPENGLAVGVPARIVEKRKEPVS